MIEQWLWGKTPAGFRRVSSDRIQIIVVREGYEAYVRPEVLFAPDEAGQEKNPLHGRGRLRLLHLGNGATALVRPFRHGGMLRHLTGEVFFTWPPRPFNELVVTEEARGRGVACPEIFAAGIERLWGPCYRGWLVTAKLEGALDLWAALQSGSAEKNGRALLRAVARELRHMHRQGVCHADLNLKNILVRRQADGLKSYIIDLDKARLFPGEVPPEKARKNLDRLLRSVCKLDPGRRHLSQDAWDLLMRFYYGEEV